MIIPYDNASDLKDIPDNIKKDLQIFPVKWIDNVLEIALESLPTALSEEDYNQGSTDIRANDDALRPEGVIICPYIRTSLIIILLT